MPKVGGIAIEKIGEPLIHCRNAEEHGATCAELPDDILRRERNEHSATAGDQRAMQRDRQPMDMEQRQGEDEAVFSCPAPGLDHAAALGEQVAVVEQGTLRASSGAGRVEEERGSLRPPTPTLPRKGG